MMSVGVAVDVLGVLGCLEDPIFVKYRRETKPMNLPETMYRMDSENVWVKFYDEHGLRRRGTLKTMVLNRMGLKPYPKPAAAVDEE